MHGLAVRAICLEDPGRHVHERAKGLGEQDEDGAFVSDPEGAECASPTTLRSGGRGRRPTASPSVDERPGALYFVRVDGQLRELRVGAIDGRTWTV
jgi:hypothetical protein